MAEGGHCRVSTCSLMGGTGFFGLCNMTLRIPNFVLPAGGWSCVLTLWWIGPHQVAYLEVAGGSERL